MVKRPAFDNLFPPLRLVKDFKIQRRDGDRNVA